VERKVGSAKCEVANLFVEKQNTVRFSLRTFHFSLFPTPLPNRHIFRYVISMLLFKKKFLDAIRTGEKTQTIRLWKYCRMRSGQRSYIPGAGYIRITGITEIKLEVLTDDDARPDGFATADLLREEIARLYPQQIADGFKAYKIEFHLLPPEEQKKQ
jgi:hypothetical protein